MRNSLRPIALILFLATTCTAFGAGGGPAPSPSMQTREPLTPEDQARNDYNAGVRLIEKADELAADATQEHREKLPQKATGCPPWPGQRAFYDKLCASR